MSKKAMLALSILICLNLGCAMQAVSTIDNDAKLKEKVGIAYQYYKERDFDKFINCFEPEISQSSEIQEDINKAKKGAAVLVNYKIIKIEITGTKAKVNMEASFIVKDKEVKQMHFDYWVFLNNDWYLYDFGKMW
jgi:uncharacterized protein YchJ